MVIEHIVEAIHAQELNGARRGEMVILCGVNASRSIVKEMTAKGLLTHKSTDVVPRYPTTEKHISRESLLIIWKGEIYGVPVLFDPDCPTNYWRVESFAGGRFDGMMFDEKQWREAIDDALRDAAEALRADDKRRKIEMVNDHLRAGRLVVKRTESWLDAVLPEDDWSKQASKEREHVKQIRAERRQAGHAAALVERLARRGQEQTVDPGALRLGYPLKHLTLTADDEAVARSEWSRRLRELQAEARRKEREQVVIDIDWE